MYKEFIFWTLDVNWTASYEVTLILLSAVLSVRPSLNFLKIGSSGFPDIGHDDSWPWYLVADEPRFFLRKIAARILGQRAQIRPEMRFFAIFLSWDH